MDADLTHNPKYIPKMIKLSDQYDLVQTNRFLDKRSIETWPIYRRILTRSRFILLKFLLGINYDSSGAYRCYNFKKNLIINYFYLPKTIAILFLGKYLHTR